MIFLTRCDVPNWACLLMFALAYMVSVLANFMKTYAEKKFDESRVKP